MKYNKNELLFSLNALETTPKYEKEISDIIKDIHTNITVNYGDLKTIVIDVYKSEDVMEIESDQLINSIVHEIENSNTKAVVTSGQHDSLVEIVETILQKASQIKSLL